LSAEFQRRAASDRTGIVDRAVAQIDGLINRLDDAAGAVGDRAGAEPQTVNIKETAA
jgi:hypothetical protein